MNRPDRAAGRLEWQAPDSCNSNSGHALIRRALSLNFTPLAVTGWPKLSIFPQIIPARSLLNIVGNLYAWLLIQATPRSFLTQTLHRYHQHLPKQVDDQEQPR